MPAVTTLRMDTAVAALAQRDKVISRMSAALGQRHDMMHLLDRNNDSLLEALLTERMLLGIGGSDP